MITMPLHIDTQLIQAWLRYQQYDLEQMAVVCECYCANTTTPTSLGEVASVLLAHGHVQAAQHLIDTRQCVPEAIPTEKFDGIHWNYMHYNPSDTNIPLLHAVVMSSNHHRRVVGGRVSNTDEVLAHVSAHRAQWNVVNNEIFEHMTPIMRLLKNSVYDGKSASTDHFSMRQYMTTAMQKDCLKFLIGLGEDINLMTDDHTCASAAMSGTKLNFDRLTHISEDASIKMIQQHRSDLLDQLVGFGYDLAGQADSAFVASMRYPLFDDQGVMTAGPDQLPWGWYMLSKRGLAPSMTLNSSTRDSVWAAAVISGNQHVIKHLLKHGHAPHWVETSSKNTLWHVGAECRYSSSIKALLSIPSAQLGAMANIPNAKGDTPMHKVVATLDLALVTHLLEAGAKVNVPDKKGYLPFERIRKTGKKAQKSIDAIAETLSQAGDMLAKKKTPSEMLPLACATMSKEMIAAMVGKGADVNVVFKDKLTPLTKIALSTTLMGAKDRRKNRHKQLEAVEQLIALGANINQPDGYGNTLLHMAVQEHLDLLVDFCFQQGIDHLLTNNNGLRADQCMKAGASEFEARDFAIIDAFIAQRVPLTDGTKPSFAPYKKSYAPLAAWKQKQAIEQEMEHIDLAEKERKPKKM